MRFFSNTNAIAMAPARATAAMEAISAMLAGSPVPGVTVGLVGSVVSVGYSGSVGFGSLGFVGSVGFSGSVGFVGSVGSTSP